MKIIIPSKGRSQTIKTHLLFKNKDYYIIVHNDSEKDEYLKNKTIDPERIIVSNQPLGISYQRQWILDNLIKDNEWFITADDNIERITGLIGLKIQPTRKDFSKELTTEQFIGICNEMIAISNINNISYCGFAVVDNYFFRLKKYRYAGYVISKLALIKKTGINYDSSILAMDDYGYTAENLLKYGKVLINNFVFPVAKHYQDGGIGNYQERLSKKIKDCVYLMNKYPELFRYKSKVGCDAKAELQVRFTTTNQVRQWQKEIFNIN